MPAKKIRKNISKFLVNQANTTDLDELEVWLKKDENKEEFNKYVKTNYLVDLNLKSFDSNQTKRIIQELIRKENRVLYLRRYSKYAAILIIALALSFWIFERNSSNDNDQTFPQVVDNEVLVPGTDKATLTLEDGSEIYLTKGEQFKTLFANSNGEEVIYNTGKNKKEIAYNYLTIPRGGEFFISLSDGTKVWLNSETKIKYPVSFITGDPREVELIYGEAYFDVTSSTENNGSEFFVKNKNQVIKVLGTEFNIKAYNNDDGVFTTLVEGSVSIMHNNTTTLLKPDQQSTLIKSNGQLSIDKVDVYNEISWKDGLFSFRKKSLNEIMKVLSRWYDIDIVIQNETLKDVGFNGVLGKDQSLEDILNIIKNFKVIESYEFKENKVILK